MLDSELRHRCQQVGSCALCHRLADVSGNELLDYGGGRTRQHKLNGCHVVLSAKCRGISGNCAKQCRTSFFGLQGCQFAETAAGERRSSGLPVILAPRNGYGQLRRHLLGHFVKIYSYGNGVLHGIHFFKNIMVINIVIAAIAIRGNRDGCGSL